jgi:hypothetical protein
MSGLRRPAADADAPILRPEFIPRRNGNFSIPASGILDEPLVCFKVNARWLSHLIGVIDALDQPDAWSGTAEQVEDARGEVRKLISSMESCDEVITDIRINNCIIEAYINGEWLPKADITSCVTSIAGDEANDEYLERPWDYPTADELPGAVSDLDCLWGGSLNLVNYIVSVASNLADIMDAAATAVDAVSDFIVLFPAFNRIAITTALGAIEGGLTIGTAVLRQGFAQEAKEVIACELFCLIRNADNGNTLTLELYEQWLDIVSNHDVDDPPQLWSLGISWVADIARDIAGRHYAFKQFQLGLNNCENDWEILCNDCVESMWCYEFDFTVSDGEWIAPAGADRGVWSSGQGWEQSFGNDACGAYISKDFARRTVTKVTMTYSLISGNLNRGGTIFLVDGGIAQDTQPVPLTNGTDLTLVWEGSETIDNIQLNVNSRSSPTLENCVASETATITKVRIEGFGLNPFGGDNC